MQFNLGQAFVDIEGKTIVDEQGVPFTIGSAAINSLLASFDDEKNLSGEDKLKRWELAMSIKNGSIPMEITVEDASLLKKLIAKAYSTMVVGQAWKMLEGK